MILIAIGGSAVLRVLRRFQLRFAFTYAPARAAAVPARTIEVAP